MGDAPAPTANESTAQMMEAYRNYAPDLFKIYQQNVLPNEQAQLAASQAVSPGYTKLQADLYNQYGPQLAQTGVDVNRVNEMGQIGIDTDALIKAQQAGGLLDQTRTAQDALDPEMAKYRAMASGKLGELLGSINVNGLSGSEQAQVERSLARDNAARGIETPTATSTISNAMTFGNELQKKRDSLGQALQVASQVAPGLSNGQNAFQTTTGRSSSTNTGTPQFAGNTTTGASTQSQGNNMLNQIAGFQNNAMNINANRRDTMDRVGEGIGMASSLGGMVGNCCWIFMEAYNGEMPYWVRKFRDAIYTPNLRGGYRKTAKLLVPLMQRSKFVRQLVNDLIIAPITAYSGYLYNIPGYEDGLKYKGYTNFWLKSWELLGRVFGSEVHTNPLKVTKFDFIAGL